MIGYPNSGKSSVINTLLGKASCKAAPIPGETKVWQYVTLMRRIYLIDSPGVVYDTGDSEVISFIICNLTIYSYFSFCQIETVLKGVVRAEKISEPTDFIAPILERVSAEYLIKHYHIDMWDDELDFLSKVARRSGKLSKGGEPDIRSVAIIVINDWQRVCTNINVLS